MMAITSMFFQDGRVGSVGGDFACRTLLENFQRRRQTEFKHSHGSLLATIGSITLEFTGKLPGYLSPSAGLMCRQQFLPGWPGRLCGGRLGPGHWLSAARFRFRIL
jgi:hypothetical protein